VKGDSKEACISAASILAKTARDAELYIIDQQYPEYGFAKHKGYPTPLHMEMLQKHGVLDIHRKTYAPVKKLLNL
jgi:ribonuclease HII